MNRPRLIRRVALALPLLVAATLSGCSSDNQHLIRRLHSFAGNSAINCGNTMFDSLVRKNNACAIGAAAQGSPFYIRWEYKDGPQTIARGIAMDSTGKMVMMLPKDDSLTIVSCLNKHLAIYHDILTQQVLLCD